MTELLTAIEMFDDPERDATNHAFEEIIASEFGSTEPESVMEGPEEVVDDKPKQKDPFGIGLMAVESVTKTTIENGGTPSTNRSVTWTSKHDGTGNLKLDSVEYGDRD